MAWQGSKTIRLIPDQQGRGGSKTSLSTQSLNLDIRLAHNVFVNYGRWTRAAKPIEAAAYPPIADVVDSFALHDYTRFDTSNAALPPQDILLSHNQKANNDQEIDQHGLGAIKTHTPPGGVKDTVPATFLNIKNRCFMCWGATNNFIYDGVVTYDVGVDGPATAATYTFGGTDSGLAAISAGSTRVNWVTSTTSGFTNDITAIILNGTLYQTLQPNPLVTTFASGTCNGTSGSTSLTIEGENWPLPMQFEGLQILIDSGGGNQEQHYINSYVLAGPDTTVTLDTPLINNQLAGTSYTLDAILGGANTQLILATPYTGLPGLTISFTSFNGPLSWGAVQPLYSYAYYDLPFAEVVGTVTGFPGDTNFKVNGAHWPPLRYEGMTLTVVDTGQSYKIGTYLDVGPDTIVQIAGSALVSGAFTTSAYTFSGSMKTYGTGHVSNASPRTQIIEQNQAGVSVILHDIMPSRVEDQARFNKILIFRTVLTGGGGVLFPFDLLNPPIGMLDNLGTTPLDFTDGNDDSLLLTTAPGIQEPPAGLNRKPDPFAHEQAWDGRIFGNPVDDPSAVVYSGDLTEVLFGVPEECYDSRNKMRIPSDDGRVTGMRLMGPFVIITTERYAYYVVGSSGSFGPNPYRLARWSTLMYGVGDYQMTEFAGSTTDDSDLMLYVGKDKKFYLTAPSVGNVSISDPIQDAFTNGIGALYDHIRLANIAIQGNHYLVVNVAFGFTAVTYDWDRKIWTNHSINAPSGNLFLLPDAFCTVYGKAQPVQFLFITNGTVYEWLGPNNTVGAKNAFIQTAPLSGDRKSRHRLQAVRIYVSDDPPEKWVVGVSIDEKPAVNRFAVQYSDPLFTIQPPGSFPIDSLTAKELLMTPLVDSQAQLDGYRFQATIAFPENEAIQEVYAIDLILTDLEPPDETSI